MTVYQNLIDSTRSHTARECGRLLFEATANDDVLRDAVSAVLALLDENVWSESKPANAHINAIADDLVAGFTKQPLLSAARRHYDRNPDPSDVAEQSIAV